MKKLNRKMCILIAIVLCILLGFMLLPNLGSWLIAEDPLHDSDIIVVLMGSIPDRILEAVDVYNKGVAPKIYLVNSHRVGYDVLLERGVQVPGSAQLSKMAAVDLGVPAENIVILDGAARSTQDEAVIMREYMMEHEDIRSIVLVTSQFHSARSKAIFEKALDSVDRDIEIISSPSKYDTFNAHEWWKDREDAKRVVLEYLKLMNFYVREQFSL